jgi:uncharacterized protein (TIGR02217 family)
MSVPTFIETPRFPDDIAYGSSGGPEFKTHVFEGHSGVEQRQAAWTVARGRWDVSYGIRDTADMDTVREFFYNCHGRASGFRFKDWSDYILTAENIGTGDASETAFQITKTYTTGSETYVRNIKKPIAGIQVFVNGVLQTITTNYTIDTTTGIITFVSPPGDTLAITVTGEFDVPVRFDTDQLSAKHEGFETETWDSIPLIEIL